MLESGEERPRSAFLIISPRPDFHAQATEAPGPGARHAGRGCRSRRLTRTRRRALAPPDAVRGPAADECWAFPVSVRADRYLGMPEHVLERWDAGKNHFERAFSLEERIAATPSSRERSTGRRVFFKRADVAAMPARRARCSRGVVEDVSARNAGVCGAGRTSYAPSEDDYFGPLTQFLTRQDPCHRAAPACARAARRDGQQLFERARSEPQVRVPDEHEDRDRYFPHRCAARTVAGTSHKECLHWLGGSFAREVDRLVIAEPHHPRDLFAEGCASHTARVHRTCWVGACRRPSPAAAPPPRAGRILLHQVEALLEAP